MESLPRSWRNILIEYLLAIAVNGSNMNQAGPIEAVRLQVEKDDYGVILWVIIALIHFYPSSFCIHYTGSLAPKPKAA